MKYLKKRKKHTPVWAVVLLDLLLVGVILVSFAFAHHVLPAMRSEWDRQEAQSSLPQIQPDPVETTAAVPEETQNPTQVPTETTEPVQTEPPVNEEWLQKFSEHFTDEVVITGNSYTSPQVSITIDTVVTGVGSSKITYYVADVHIASIGHFTCSTANNELRYFTTQPPLEMAAQANAILAISGDYLTYQKTGFMIRNGQIYVADHNQNSICVLYRDGSMETLEGGAYDMQEIIGAKPLQVWSFGPVLLDENGQPKASYDTNSVLNDRHPRSAIGYYEPGHYCFVVVDGRQDHSWGMTLDQLAQVFADLGCTAAYNLDGGGSAVMLFGGEFYSRQSNGGRDLGDLLVITEPGYGAQEEE